MDIVSHLAIGALCADLGFRKKMGKKAYVFGALSALLPDLDIFLRFPFSTPISLLIHRSFSHSLFLLPFFSAIFAYLIKIYFQKRKNEVLSFFSLWQLCFLGYFLHVLFDFFNSYGVYLFWPLNFKRYYLDILPLVNPFFTLGLLFLIYLSVKKSLNKIFIAFLLWSIFYLTFFLIEKEIVKKEQDKIILARGEKILKRRVLPTSGSIFRWRSLYYTDKKLYADEIKSVPFFFPQIYTGQNFYLAKEEHIQTSPQTRDEMIKGFRIFEHFSDGFIAFVPSRVAHIQTIGDFRNLRIHTAMEFNKYSIRDSVVVRRNLK